MEWKINGVRRQGLPVIDTVGAIQANFGLTDINNDNNNARQKNTQRNSS